MKKKLLAMLCAFGCIMAFTGCNTTGGTSDSSTPDASNPDSTPVCNHTYDNACDADCNVCGEERTPAEHVYDNACDADCKVCGEVRTPAEHVYDNEGDKDCNECDEERELNKYTVMFDVDGGSAVESQTVEYGTSADELANFSSTKTGYEFAGWTMADGSAIPAGATITGDITVKAAWNIVTYTAKVVRVNGNEETVEFTIENRAEKLAAIALTANDAQYTYSWVSTLPDELALNNDQVFTEKRDVNNYTVTFDSNGGSTVESQTVPYGTSVDELANFTSTKTGYEFAGWTMADGSTIPTGATVMEDITVKASWTPSVNTAYNVEIYLEELSGYPVTATQTIAQTGTTDATVEIDYDWMAEQELSIPEGYCLDSEKSVFSGAIAADGSLVLKVYLKLNEYSVTINGISSNVKHGTTLSLPVAPEKDGYIFKEWQINGEKVDGTYDITGDTTVDAAWFVDLTTNSLFEIDLSSSNDYVLNALEIGKVTAISINNNNVEIASNDASSVTIANATVKALNLKGGEYSNLVLTTETAEYMVKFTAVSQYLNAENVTSYAELKAILEADMNGYYVLTGNIDLAAAGNNSQRATRAIGFGAASGTTHTGYTEFNGTIDGRGYAIQNLEYNWRADGGNHDHAFIDVIGANGVLKNIAFTNVSAVVSGARIAGVAWTNKGTIENCYIDYTNTAGVSGQNAEWGQAVIALINEGAVKDCITKLTTTATTGSNRLAIVTNNTGTVTNVNAIVDIISDVDPVVVFVDSGSTADSACVTAIDVFFMANSDAKYTSTYWMFDEATYSVQFGQLVLYSPTVHQMSTVVELDKTASESLSLDISELGAGIRSIELNGNEIEYVLSDGILTIAYEQLSSYVGECALTVDMGKGIYSYTVILVTKYLNAENVTSYAELKAILEADMNGYYVLTSNIDLAAAGNNSQRATRAIGFGAVSSTTHTGYTEFNGTIDGRGYAIQNLEYNWRADGGNHDHAFIDVIGANGVLKNIAFTNVRAVVSGARIAGIAWTNKGMIENCYIDYTNTAGVSGQNAEWGQAVIALINEGAVKDCITKLTTTASTGTNRLAMVSKNTGTVTNVNAIVDIISDVDPVVVFVDSGATADSACAATVSGFYTANSDAKYTSAYWTFDDTNNGISFGSVGKVL